MFLCRPWQPLGPGGLSLGASKERFASLRRRLLNLRSLLGPIHIATSPLGNCNSPIHLATSPLRNRMSKLRGPAAGGRSPLDKNFYRKLYFSIGNYIFYRNSYFYTKSCVFLRLFIALELFDLISIYRRGGTQTSLLRPTVSNTSPDHNEENIFGGSKQLLSRIKVSKHIQLHAAPKPPKSRPKAAQEPFKRRPGDATRR